MRNNPFSVGYEVGREINVQVPNYHHAKNNHYDEGVLRQVRDPSPNIQESGAFVLVHDPKRDSTTIIKRFDDLGIKTVNFVHLDLALDYLLSHKVSNLVLDCDPNSEEIRQFLHRLNKMLPPASEAHQILVTTCDGIKIR